MSEFMKMLLEIALAILALGICVIFIRAIIGPRFTDRIVAINMIGTMTTAIICILSVYLKEICLIDVSLVYTLLSFLAVVIICHVVSLHHKGRELFLKRMETEAEEK
ncbi:MULTISPECIES: monovalent cation/H+ antiporter complex subunit F [Anaerotignum]|uniref:monovalent cation/H+ antiporter complex subunit F n=1 Tax=Anaerotignum TaxID=2039240 RepID=UPI00210A3D67|nr:MULTISPECIES: monovalent cation/H+ antiporter complex subunit F [Anaerotignum]MCQ4937160.1 monovalent cation/H+ antiporter complex subunit F [Anaerotignum propionicum]